MRKAILSLIVFLSFSQTAFAQSESRVVKDNLNPGFLIGGSELRFWGLKVYQIFLWSEHKNFSYDKKFAIQINYNMAFSSEDLAKRSIYEIKRNHFLSEQEEKKYYLQLKQIFTPVKSGDQKVALFIPDQGLLMFSNANLNGKVSDLRLARLFVDIWLDEKSSYPEITRKILGKE